MPSRAATDLEAARVAGLKDFYEILDIKRGASNDDIKKAYQKQSRRFHPDKCGAPRAKEAFQVISAAYEVLSNPARRRDYQDQSTGSQSFDEYCSRNRWRDPMELFREFEYKHRDEMTAKSATTAEGKTDKKTNDSNSSTSEATADSLPKKLAMVIGVATLAAIISYFQTIGRLS